VPYLQNSDVTKPHIGGVAPLSLKVFSSTGPGQGLRGLCMESINDETRVSRPHYAHDFHSAKADTASASQEIHTARPAASACRIAEPSGVRK